MKISYSESGRAAEKSGAAQTRILPQDRPKKLVHAQDVNSSKLSPLEHGMAVAEVALQDVPDVRQELVNDLKERIAKGEYKVSGQDIADMMLRRRAADRIR